MTLPRLRTLVRTCILEGYKRRSEFDSQKSALRNARWRATEALCQAGYTQADAERFVRLVWAKQLALVNNERSLHRALMRGW